MFGTTEIIIICLIVFVLFGASAIPKFAKSLGQAKKEFKEGLDDAKESAKEESSTKASAEQGSEHKD